MVLTNHHDIHAYAGDPTDCPPGPAAQISVYGDPLVSRGPIARPVVPLCKGGGASST